MTTRETIDASADPTPAGLQAPSRARAQLFALSFAALFLELMVIRWAPSSVRMVAYYANLMLISSFLGLGVGAMLARRRQDTFRALPWLLAAFVGFLLLSAEIPLPVASTEWRFFSSPARLLNYATLLGVFFLNAAVFVPIGQRLGRLFETLPALEAYAWDLGGSLAGTLAFGIFSLTHFSPVAGMAIVMLLVALLMPRRDLLLAAPLLALTLVGVWLTNDRNAIWSPYYYITVREKPAGSAVDLLPSVPEPPAALRTMIDPPDYVVSVNHDFYQPEVTLDMRRFTDERLPRVRYLRSFYDVPYALGDPPQRVLVLGSGGGTDAEVALLNGATTIDAVEIDPALVRLSRRFNASGIYDDPSVTIHIDDARAFIQRCTERYDLVVFGWLDSQALFSYMSNLRLDGYVYTVESIKRAYELVDDDGLLSLSFAVGRPWMADKLYATIHAATGREPMVYYRADQVVLCVRKGPDRPLPSSVGSFQRLLATSGPDASAIDLPTDDWPYLYLSRRTIPSDYLAIIGLLLAISVPTLLALRGRSFERVDLHFLFLGAGFLLLQTTSISACSLYFGTTYLVTTVIVAGVLVMVLAANLVAMRMRAFTPWLYAPLLASLLVLHLVPRQEILGLPLAARLAWTLLVVPLPIFFAGLIFSTTFRGRAAAASLLGANLIGATLGGFCEYLGMVTGHQALLMIVGCCYLASLACSLGFAGARSALPTT